jgi:glycosyltransferase involved in cell wall biosynthesis
LKACILYSELGDYSIACLKALGKSGVQLMLVHWPVNKEAPFKFDFSFINAVHSRDELSDTQLVQKVESFNPNLILTSGWMDKGYVKVCRSMKSKSVRVLSLDNHWTGSMKQHAASLVSPFTIKKVFDKAFVPGEVQKQYALKLGFDNKDIQTGFYSADTSKFNSIFNEIDRGERSSFPKRLLYLGRYTKHKGIFDLWEAFSKFRENNQEWELWCVGTGDQFVNRLEAEGIKHFGFIQPDEMLPILKEIGVYVLPSHFEPWGVSVHEMAVAGFPMLLSDKIGAKEAFLDGNGREFRSNNTDELLKAMTWITNLSKDELLDRSTKSHELGMKNSPEIWADKLMSFLR